MPHELSLKCMHGAAGRLSTVESDLLNAPWASMREGTLEAMGLWNHVMVGYTRVVRKGFVTEFERLCERVQSSAKVHSAPALS